MSQQLRILFTLVLLFAVILSGCSNDKGEQTPAREEEKQNGVIVEEPKTPTEGGDLRIGVLELPMWNPFKWREATPQYSTAERLVYRGLFTYSLDQQLVPDLIKEYTIEDVDDKKVIRFTLDDQVKWQDGTSLSYEDISFSLHTYLNPFYYGAWKQNLSYINGTSAFRSGKSERISGIKQEESGEIILEITDATSSFYHALTAPILPAHQLKELNMEEIHHRLSEGKVVGNGPFQFSEQNNTELRLSRVASFSEGGPYLDGITFRLYNGDVATLGAEPQYDLLAVTPQVEKELATGYQKYDVAQNAYYYLGFNFTDAVLSNKEVRIAIGEVIDRRSIIDRVLYEHGIVVDSIIPKTSWLYNDLEGSIEPEIEEARNRINALGYSAEKPLKLTIHYQGDHLLVEKLVSEISNQLAAIHIKVDKKPLMGEEYYAYLFSGKPTQVFVNAWPFSKDIGYWWKLYGSYHDVKDLGLNIFHYRNAKADQLLKELYTTPPTKAQKQTAVDFLNELTADRILVPLFVPHQSYWVSKRVHDQVINGDGWFIDSTKWWMEK